MKNLRRGTCLKNKYFLLVQQKCVLTILSYRKRKWGKEVGWKDAAEEKIKFSV